MTWGFVAVGVASVVVGGINAYSSHQASKAQLEGLDSASRATVLANRESIAANKEALERSIELNEPFRQAGLEVLPQLLKEIQEGFPTFDEFVESPEAASIREQELKDITESTERSAAARGNLFSPSTQLAIQDKSMQKTAASKLGQYDAAISRDQQELNNLFNLVNVGRGASTDQSSDVMQSGGSVSNIITQGGVTQGNLAINSANARASNYINQGNAATNVISNLGSSIALRQFLQPSKGG